MSLIAVIDFETTGLSPAMGDRATEVAIVLVQGARVVDRFQSLMNAGVSIPAFITGLTGISNAMVAAAPDAATVMAAASRFVGSAPMVAHNASFDRKFWAAELARAGVEPAAAAQPFACTMLVNGPAALRQTGGAGADGAIHRCGLSVSCSGSVKHGDA